MVTSISASVDAGEIVMIACCCDVDDAHLQCGDGVARREAAILGNFQLNKTNRMSILRLHECMEC